MLSKYRDKNEISYGGSPNPVFQLMMAIKHLDFKYIDQVVSFARGNVILPESIGAKALHGALARYLSITNDRYAAIAELQKLIGLLYEMKLINLSGSSYFQFHPITNAIYNGNDKSITALAKDNALPKANVELLNEVIFYRNQFSCDIKLLRLLHDHSVIFLSDPRYYMVHPVAISLIIRDASVLDELIASQEFPSLPEAFMAEAFRKPFTRSLIHNDPDETIAAIGIIRKHKLFDLALVSNTIVELSALWRNKEFYNFGVGLGASTQISLPIAIKLNWYDQLEMAINLAGKIEIDLNGLLYEAEKMKRIKIVQYLISLGAKRSYANFSETMTPNPDDLEGDLPVAGDGVGDSGEGTIFDVQDLH